jgi:hypothetical protein
MNSEFKRNNHVKLWKKRSFFPTSAFRLPTFLILIQILTPLMLWASGTDSQNIGTLSASLDQTSVAVGGVVQLTLGYRLPPGGRLLEKPEIKGLDGISVLTQTIAPGQIRIHLLVDHLGPWRSEPIRLNYLDATGQTRHLTAPPVSIQVVSNLGEQAQEAELRPIRDIVPVQSIWQSYRLWLGAVGALILIGLALWWWHKRRQKAGPVAEYQEPADVRARRELLGLETQRYFENGQAKKHYFVFSEILRRYLGSIRNFPAVELTTEEIARHVRGEPDRNLIALLQGADLVKFADTVPTRARKEEDIKAALAYIRQTGPPPIVAAGKAHRPEVRQ